MYVVVVVVVVVVIVVVVVVVVVAIGVIGVILVFVVLVIIVVLSTMAPVSPQWAFVILEDLLIATYTMVPACLKGKLSLTAVALASLLLRHLHQIPYRSDISPTSNEHMFFIADCFASDEQRGPPLFFAHGVVPTELRCHGYVAVTD